MLDVGPVRPRGTCGRDGSRSWDTISSRRRSGGTCVSRSGIAGHGKAAPRVQEPRRRCLRDPEPRVQNPAISYFVPLPGMVAIIYASSQGVSGATMALVCTGAAIFTWLAWEAAVWVVSRSQVAYHLVTRWEARASKAQRNTLQAAESHWRDRQW